MTPAAQRVERGDAVARLAVALPAGSDPDAAVDALATGLDTLPRHTRALVVTVSDGVGAGPRAGRCGELLDRLEALPMPTVAAVDGACHGLALAAALCCDVRIAGAAATLSLPAARPPDPGTVTRLVRATGQGVARDLLLTGRTVTGEEALCWGLVTRLAPDGVTAAAAASTLAAELATLSPEALAATKRLALAAAADAFADGLAAELALWREVRAGANAQEGLSAFADKRPPVFRGGG